MSPTYVLFRHGGATPLGTSGPNGYTPAQIRHAYGFDQITFNNGTVTGDGSGTTIAIVDAYDDPNIANDLHQFDLKFNLPDPTFTKVNQNGNSSPLPSPNHGWATEIALDVEWAHAIAPGANILLVEARSNSFGDLLTAVDTARNTAGVVAVSMSWGSGEFFGETSYDSHFQTPSGHAGVTFVASSGDTGSLSYPAISPNVVAAGGTTLNLDASGNYISESGWSGSGHGVSTYEAQPSYQNGVVNQFSTTKRTNADVAYDSNPSTGFPVYDTYNNSVSAPWTKVGGTSAAAPQWAALVAIADQGRALLNLGSLDGPYQTLPMLYSSLFTVDFHDISPSGYDLVTGRGSPYANRIVADLVGPQQGGFEAPNLGTGPAAYQYSPSGTAWTFSDGAGVAGNGSDFTAGNPNAPGGTQVAFLQATGSISQSLTFAAGTYSVSFSAAQRGNYQSSSQQFQVLIDGNVVGTFTPPDTNYTAYTTASFTVTAGAHTITFVGIDPDGGDNTAFIDLVQLNSAT